MTAAGSGAGTTREFDVLANAIEDTQTLLGFACEHRREVSDALVSGLLSSIEKIQANRHDAAAQAAFWNHYRELSAKTAGVTAQSIRATRGLQNRRLLSARGGLTAATAIVFILIIALQILWGYGSSYRAGLDKQASARSELNLKLAAAHRQLEERSRTLELAQKANPAVSADELAMMKRNSEESKRALELASQEIFLNRDAHAAAVDLYRCWHSFGWMPCRKCPTDDAKLLTEVQLYKLRENGALLTDGLQRYGLVILMGLLGTLVLLLRQVEQQVQDTTYAGSPVASILIRCALGMVAGTFCTLFMPAEMTANLVKGLPAMGIAFVAGYSLELFFGLLDTVVKALSRTETKPKAPNT